MKWVGCSLFQALSQWGRSKKRFLDERDLVKKIGEGGQIPLVPRPLFRSCPLTESLEQARLAVKMEYDATWIWAEVRCSPDRCRVKVTLALKLRGVVWWKT